MKIKNQAEIEAHLWVLVSNLIIYNFNLNRYVSPELLKDDECNTPADIWALGCIIYKMFTGKTPFYD